MYYLSGPGCASHSVVGSFRGLITGACLLSLDAHWRESATNLPLIRTAFFLRSHFLKQPPLCVRLLMGPREFLSIWPAELLPQCAASLCVQHCCVCSIPVCAASLCVQHPCVLSIPVHAASLCAQHPCVLSIPVCMASLCMQHPCACSILLPQTRSRPATSLPSGLPPPLPQTSARRGLTPKVRLRRAQGSERFPGPPSGAPGPQLRGARRRQRPPFLYSWLPLVGLPISTASRLPRVPCAEGQRSGGVSQQPAEREPEVCPGGRGSQRHPGFYQK